MEPVWGIMRRFAIEVTVALVASMVLTVPASAHKSVTRSPKRPVCRLGGAHGGHRHRIAADAEAEVYRGFVEESNSVLGCVYGRRPRLLGLSPTGLHEEGLPRARRIVLDGAMVAFESTELGGDGEKGEIARLYVEVVDLRTGLTVHKAPTGALTQPSNPSSVGAGEATSIVVKTDGAVAWIAENYKETRATGARYYQVHALDKNGERVLASGNGVAPRSLALAGSTIYWTQEGKPFSAPLE